VAVQRHCRTAANFADLENIDESALIVADVTFLNLNVVYEIGYAIGKKKRAFLVRSSTLGVTKPWPEPRAFSTRWATWSMPMLRDCLLV
jgi:nucleoside 2-deoxyribosyltransferase